MLFIWDFVSWDLTWPAEVSLTAAKSNYAYCASLEALWWVCNLYYHSYSSFIFVFMLFIWDFVSWDLTTNLIISTSCAYLLTRALLWNSFLFWYIFAFVSISFVWYSFLLGYDHWPTRQGDHILLSSQASCLALAATTWPYCKIIKYKSILVKQGKS